MGIAHLRTSGALAALLLGTLGCTGGASDAEPVEVLAVEPGFLELGTVTRGERTSGTWTLRNVSGEPLHVLRVGPLPCSCGSAELVLPDRVEGATRFDVGEGEVLDLVLATDERAELHFTFDSSRYRQPISRKVVSVPIILRDHPGVVAECAVDVWTPFVVEPWAIELGEIGVREEASGFVLVAAHDDDRFGLSVDTEIDGWRVVSQKVSTADSERDSYQVTVTAPFEMPQGPFSQAFLLRTDTPGAPAVRFVAQGIVVPDVGASPQRLVFDPQADRSEAELRVWNRAVGGALGELELLRADGPIELAAQGPSADGDSARRVVTLRWTGDAPTEMVSGRLVLGTGVATTPEIQVLWTVMPAR